MTKFLAVFKGGNELYSTYGYVFEVWTDEQCRKVFPDDFFDRNFYFVLRNGIIYIRGGYETFEQAKNSYTEWLRTEDNAVLDSVTDYDGSVSEWIMNIDSI